MSRQRRVWYSEGVSVKKGKVLRSYVAGRY